MRRAVPFLALAVAATCHSSAIAQAQGEPLYGIKEERPRTGSHIREYLVRPIDLPVNRTYAELSPEDRQKWHANYEDIKDGDEPPFPAEGLKAILGPMATLQQKLLVDGDLFLIATIDSKGEAVSVKAIGSPSPTMTQVAAKILMLTKYKPALCSGQPCRMDFPLRLKFVVK